MFQMNCPNCGRLVNSPPLADARPIECPQCSETVIVKNVRFINKQPSTNYKSSLKDILYFSKSILKLNKFSFDLKKKYVMRERLSKNLIRDGYRLNINNNLYCEINFEEKKRLARLLNLSYEGAGIEFTERGQLPENNTETLLTLLLPEHAESFSLPANVVWIRTPSKDTIFPSITMGLQFNNIEKKTHRYLSNFIWGSSR